jgi:hypothetical protein
METATAAAAAPQECIKQQMSTTIADTEHCLEMQ